MKTNMPGFTAEKALTENRSYSQTTDDVHAGFWTSESAQQFESHNGPVVHPRIL
jgi:hypothetical protein